LLLDGGGGQLPFASGGKPSEHKGGGQLPFASGGKPSEHKGCCCCSNELVEPGWEVLTDFFEELGWVPLLAELVEPGWEVLTDFFEELGWVPLLAELVVLGLKEPDDFVRELGWVPLLAELVVLGLKEPDDFVRELGWVPLLAELVEPGWDCCWELLFSLATKELQTEPTSKPYGPFKTAALPQTNSFPRFNSAATSGLEIAWDSLLLEIVLPACWGLTCGLVAWALAVWPVNNTAASNADVIIATDKVLCIQRNIVAAIIKI
jgi:hypothetical protein